MSDVVVMLETGWSWQELQMTPEHVVNDVKVYLRKRALISREKARAREALG